MIFVKAAPGDTTDSVIRKFTRKVISEGLLLELKKKEFYQNIKILLIIMEIINQKYKL